MPGLPPPPVAPSEGTLAPPPVSKGPKGSAEPPLGSVEIVQPDGTTETTGYQLIAGPGIALAAVGSKGTQIAAAVNASMITGVLAPANGGTGLSDPGPAGSLLESNGAGLWIDGPAPGANGNLLTSNGAGQWVSSPNTAASNAQLSWSWVDWWTTKQVIDSTNYVWTTGADFTVGCAFYALASTVVVSGVHFIYLPSDHNPRTIKFGLVDMTTSTRIDNVSVALVDGQTGIANFPASHTLVQGHLYAVVGYATVGGHAYPTDAIHTNNGPDWAQTSGGQNNSLLWRPDGHILVPATAVVFGNGDTSALTQTFVIKNNLMGVEPVFSA